MSTQTKIFSMFVIVFLLLTGCAPVANAARPASTVAAAAIVSNISTAPAATTVTPQVVAATAAGASTSSLAYPIVDTAQGKCYNASTEIPCSQDKFFGQDAQYTSNAPRYQNNGDGTVTDLVTGLMWQQDPGEKTTFSRAVAGASSLNLAGYKDWRVPTIKELYSLILFDGTDVSACATSTCSVTPFVDTRYFKFQYGNTTAGERVIDSQFVTSTKYVSTTMNGDETVFGVNFADGRIKGYGLNMRGSEKTFFVLYVRGNTNYGKNNFADNGNGTITDSATGLTWMQADSGKGLNWEAALDYCEKLELGGATDWRLPNVKELQSIVDYTRSPATTNSAAIAPIFKVSSITDETKKADYPFYWSSTTHADSSGRGSFAAYVAFGKALGYMGNAWLDVHGAGAQRSDPKVGSASEYPTGHGPQGDAVRVSNYARCVRDGSVTSTVNGNSNSSRPTMSIQSTGIQQNQPGANQPGGQGLPNQPTGIQPNQSGGNQSGGGQGLPNQGQPPLQGGQNASCVPNLTKAASVLNVTVEKLQSALGDPSKGRPDLAVAASKLGVSVEALRQAMQQATPSNCPTP